jgi:flagellar basal body rod protein FlgB
MSHAKPTLLATNISNTTTCKYKTRKLKMQKSISELQTVSFKRLSIVVERF